MDPTLALKKLRSDKDSAKLGKEFKDAIEKSESDDADFLEDLANTHEEKQDAEEGEPEEQEPEEPPAEDLSLGQISSAELSKFKTLPLAQQNAIIENIKKAQSHRDKPEKAKEFQAKAQKLLSGDATYVGDASYHVKAGQKAKEEGKPETANPYPRGSDPYRQWREGYRGTYQEPYANQAKDDAEGGILGPRDRSAFLYFESDDPDHAQCGTCRNFLIDQERCYWLGKDDFVDADDTCALYGQGPPHEGEDTKPTGEYTPEEAGFFKGRVQCHRCNVYDDRDPNNIHCDLYVQLNRMFPELWNLEETVKPHGCCNAWSNGERDPERFGPYGPIPDEEDESTGGILVKQGLVQDAAPDYDADGSDWLDKPADYVVPAKIGPIEGSPADPDTPRFVAALTGTPEIDRLLTHPLTRALLSNPIVDRSHTEPYMAGASEGLHDPTVYIDEHIPLEQTIPSLSNPRKYIKFDPAWFWIIHEDIELLVMTILIRAGMPPALAYKCAHYLFAELAERAAYKFFDINQIVAEKEQQSWEGSIERENANNVPKNLYRKPYPHGHVHDATKESIEDVGPTKAEAAVAMKIVRDSPEFKDHAEFKSADGAEDALDGGPGSGPRPHGGSKASKKEYYDHLLNEHAWMEPQEYLNSTKEAGATAERKFAQASPDDPKSMQQAALAGGQVAQWVRGAARHRQVDEQGQQKFSLATRQPEDQALGQAYASSSKLVSARKQLLDNPTPENLGALIALTKETMDHVKKVETAREQKRARFADFGKETSSDALDAGFHEEDHPRDHGKFTSKGASAGASAKPSEKREGAGEPSGGRQDRTDAGSPSRVQKVKSFFKQPGVNTIIANSVESFLTEHAKGVIEQNVHHQYTGAVHAAIAFGLEHLGASIPEAVATAALGYAITTVLDKVGIGPHKVAHLAHQGLLKTAKALLNAHKLGKLREAKGNLEEADAMPDFKAKQQDDIGSALEQMVAVLSKTPTEVLLKQAKNFKGNQPMPAQDSVMVFDRA